MTSGEVSTELVGHLKRHFFYQFWKECSTNGCPVPWLHHNRCMPGEREKIQPSSSAPWNELVHGVLLGRILRKLVEYLTISFHISEKYS